MIKLLLLEDDHVLAESLIELLQSENFDIVHVLNSQKALDKTFLQKFDLLLLDVNVPLFNGFELLKSLSHFLEFLTLIFKKIKILKLKIILYFILN